MPLFDQFIQKSCCVVTVEFELLLVVINEAVNMEHHHYLQVIHVIEALGMRLRYARYV